MARSVDSSGAHSTPLISPRPPLPPQQWSQTQVDRVLRPDWSFKIFSFPDGYAACVARGPPSACSKSGQEAGVIADPDDASERGQSLPQLRFRRIGLQEVVPEDVAARLFGGGL